MTDVDRSADLFSIMGKLDVSIGGVKDELEKQRKARDAYMRASVAEAPRFINILGSVVLSSAGFGVIEFNNNPDQGHFWYVRKLVVGGVTTTTTTAGRADVFVTSSELTGFTTLGQIGLADWKDQAATLPSVGTYSRGELAVNAPKKLYVVISGGTSGQQVIVSGDVEDYQEGTAANRLGF